MSDFDSVLMQVIEDTSSCSQGELQSDVLSEFNTNERDSMGHKLKMIAWDQQ